MRSPCGRGERRLRVEAAAAAGRKKAKATMWFKSWSRLEVASWGLVWRLAPGCGAVTINALSIFCAFEKREREVREKCRETCYVVVEKSW